MGPKFAIVFSGADVNGVSNFMQGIKGNIEQMQIPAADDYYYEDEETTEEGQMEIKTENGDVQDEEQEVFVSPKIRVAISTYYKGTSLDGALKKVEEYIDLSDENTISTL